LKTHREVARQLRAEAVALRAAAKGAFAEARALVPWYQRKMWWLVAIIGIGAGIAAANSGVDSVGEFASTSDDTTTTSSIPPTSTSLLPSVVMTTIPVVDSLPLPVTTNSIGSGIGSQDASGDVKISTCGTVDSIGFRYPRVTVVNRSSKSSDYYITIVYESVDGSVKYDDSFVMVDSLNPGQSISKEGLPVSDVPSKAVCKVTEVQRTAS